MLQDYAFLNTLSQGIQVNFDKPIYQRDQNIAHAPYKKLCLNKEEQKLALKNALRYFQPELHNKLAQEFLNELQTYGHIYMYRLIPDYVLKAYPYEKYPAKCKQAQVIMHMIMNNLDHEVAQFPHELVTYGGNGSVFQNWAQYHLTMKYLSEINENQTLIMNSGHPQGLFPSHPNSPRIVISNGMMIPNYSGKDYYEKHYALGNTMYGQMTAGSYCYIGSQGIVHGTTLTLLNAARKYLNKDNLRGVVFVSSGLGGMSGAQPKAGDILECISVIAEVSEKALDKRLKQGWVKRKCTDVEEVVKLIKEAKQQQKAESIGYLGNVVLLWERLALEQENLIELGSDQTSLHNPFNGGYYPVQLTFEEANKLMVEDSELFKTLVYESLKRQVNAINILTQKGMHFWDYGNCFLLESRRAGADININENKFRYPSYFQDIMGDIFSLGFGPFRWICSSGNPEDLKKSDKIAEEVLIELIDKSPKIVSDQLKDNLEWIKKADSNKLVIGSQARILYADTQGRCQIALRFNEAIKNGLISGPIVLSRDHHDVSGTDSPFRETADIYDGSQFTADMAIQNVIGDSFRGATWVAIHNGGGVGWGEVINGGFGLVLDGSDEASKRAKEMLSWDVNNGVARRSWSGNQNALFNIKRQMEMEPLLKVTLPYTSDNIYKYYQKVNMQFYSFIIIIKFYQKRNLKIYQMNKQLIAAHRGLSSLYPENTLQGLIAALPYCDYVEFDVIANKDLDLLVCHDTFLSRISDIENHPQFSNRKCKRMYKKEMKEDWWICDFTTSEIQSLKLHQSLLTRKSQFDNQLTISLLKDVLLSLLEYNKKNQTNCGVLLEIKDLQFHQENLNIFMAEPIIHLLKTMGLENNQQLPIQIMAFDTPFLLYAKQHCPQLPRVQLIRIEDLGYETKIVKEIAEYANSIGVNLKLLWNKENQCKSQLCNEAKQLGLLIYGWTFQDDNEEILKYFQVKTPKEVYEVFSFLDGIITEFPQNIYQQ